MKQRGRMETGETRARNTLAGKLYPQRVAKLQRPTIADFPGIPQPLDPYYDKPATWAYGSRHRLIEDAEQLQWELSAQKNGHSSYSSFSSEQAWKILRDCERAIGEDICQELNH